MIVASIASMVAVVVLSWLPRRPGSMSDRAFRALRTFTDPVLVPLRRVIPPVGGVIDLSPAIVVIVLLLVHRLLS